MKLHRIVRRLYCPLLVGALLYCWPATSAAYTADDILALYWDGGLSEVTINPSALPDTVTARIVLENPSLRGDLLQCRFQLTSSTNTIVDFQSDLGPIVQLSSTEYELTLPDPFILGPEPLLATFRVAVVSPDLDEMTLSSGSYSTDTSSANTNPPSGFEECAWINVGTPDLQYEPLLLFPTIGTNRTEFRTPLIYNRGDAPFFTNFGLGNSGACGPFTILYQALLPEVIPPNRAANPALSFSPQTPGDYKCTLTIGAGVALPIQGAGRWPIVSLAGPAVVDFGPVAVGGVEHVLFDIINDGDFTVDASLDPASLCPNFHLTSGPGSLTPGNFGRFTMSYEAQDLDPHQCHVVFGDSLLTVLLTGSGYEGVMGATTSPDTAFAFTGTGESSILYFSIQNTGDVFIEPDFHLTDPAGVFALTDSLPARIEPGNWGSYGVTFSPVERIGYSGNLSFGTGIPELPLRGQGQFPYANLDFPPTPLLFPPTNPGESSLGTWQVHNSGNQTTRITVSSVSPLVSDLTPGSILLKPGEAVDFSATYAPIVYGQHEFNIIQDALEPTVLKAIGPPRYDFATDENHLGLYFDPAFSATETTLPVVPQSVNAYLVFSNPSDLSGVNAWQCQVGTTPGAVLVGATLEGGLVDGDSNINGFVAGFGPSPLPPSADIHLATLQFAIWDMSYAEFGFSLQAHPDPDIPGLMTWLPGADGSLPVPMVTASGLPEVAWVHLSDIASGVDAESLPRATQLLPNVPNPFNPVTEIRFELAEPSHVKLVVYDVMGRRVRILEDAPLPAGAYSPVWDGRDQRDLPLPSGAYYVRLETGQTVARRKVLLLK